MSAPDPVEDAVRDVGNRALQLAHLAAQLAETSARNIAQRAARAEEASRAEVEAARSAAARQWIPLHEPSWRRRAPDEDLLSAWSAAHDWAGRDTDAARAFVRAEIEMTRRWPDAMNAYNTFTRQGVPAPEALAQALNDAAVQQDQQPPAPRTAQRDERIREVIERVGGSALAAQIEREPGAESLYETLRSAESRGADLPRLVSQAIAQRDLSDAKSVSDVLRWRIEKRSASAHAMVGMPGVRANLAQPQQPAPQQAPRPRPPAIHQQVGRSM